MSTGEEQKPDQRRHLQSWLAVLPVDILYGFFFIILPNNCSFPSRMCHRHSLSYSSSPDSFPCFLRSFKHFREDHA